MTDIAPTLMAQATGRHSALPTDGIDLMPHLTGALPPPKDRLHFWANVPRFADLTGSPEFEPGVASEKMEQRVLIRDDQKIIWWKLPVTRAEGAVFKSLTNAVESEEPSLLLAERTPLAGLVPLEGPGKGLLEQLNKLIADSAGDLLPNWSGEPSGRGEKSESDEPEPGAPQTKKRKAKR
jgi:hypothetical protein